MIGILLVTHAPLGQAFIQAVSHVFRACPERIEAIDVVADQDTAQVRAMASEAISRLDDGSGVLVITDIIGGTPAMCSLPLCQPGHVEIIAGISLPMLLRALTYRQDNIEVVMEMALAGGQSGAQRIDNRLRVGPH